MFAKVMFGLTLVCLRGVGTNDLILGAITRRSRVLFSEVLNAGVAPWTRVRHLTVHGHADEVITAVRVYDLKKKKDGIVRLDGGEIGQSKIILGLKSGGPFKGYAFKVVIYGEKPTSLPEIDDHATLTEFVKNLTQNALKEALHSNSVNLASEETNIPSEESEEESKEKTTRRQSSSATTKRIIPKKRKKKKEKMTRIRKTNKQKTSTTRKPTLRTGSKRNGTFERMKAGMRRKFGSNVIPGSVELPPLSGAYVRYDPGPTPPGVRPPQPVTYPPIPAADLIKFKNMLMRLLNKSTSKNIELFR